MTVTVVGVDLSLTSTGIAAVTVDGLGGTWRTWRVASPTRGRDLTDQHARISDATVRILAAVTTVPADLCVVESPAYGKAQMAFAHDLAGLWWRVVAGILDTGLPVAQVAPSSLKVYTVGYGGSAQKPVRKSHVQAAVAAACPAAATGGIHDVADAIGLAAMGARWLGHPVDCLPDHHIAAISRAKWPTTERTTSADR